MKGYVICDLDGCLSDDRWRRNLLPEGQGKNAEAYDRYHSLCDSDELVQSVFGDLMYDAFDEEDRQVALFVFVTARPDRHDYRAKTEYWLSQNFVDTTEYVLLMRPNQSVLPSPITKINLLNTFFAGEHCDPIDGWSKVISAYDDRLDVLEAYPIAEERKQLRVLASTEPCLSKKTVTVPEILTAMADTFKERNAVYEDNYLRVAPIISILWPHGVPSSLVTEDRWHLFELMIVKLTRFAISDLKHIDSIHDAAVYAAMIESDLRRNV